MREVFQSIHQERAKWLYAKYRKEQEWPYISEELKKYAQCEIFKEDCRMESIFIEGAVVVNMTGEESILSENELKLLKREPKYCMLKSCSGQCTAPAMRRQAQ